MKEVQTILMGICAEEKVQRCFVTEPEEIVRLGVPGVNLRTISSMAAAKEYQQSPGGISF